MFKVLAVAVVLAVTKAADYQAAPLLTFNNNHNSVYHDLPSPPAAVIAAGPAKAAVSAPALQSVVGKLPKAPAAIQAPVLALPVAAPVSKSPTSASAAIHYHKEEYAHAPAKYQFAYAIEDSHTGDYHSQQEKRDGDKVVGQYELHEADGTVRIVKYSDEGHGFNAIVERHGTPTAAPARKKSLES